MKGKSLKIVFAILALATIVSILLSNTITFVNSNNAVTSLDKAYAVVGDMSGGLNAKSYVDTSVDYSEYSAVEVLKEAAKYLGIAYASSNIKAKDNRTTGDFRCGELVSYAIYDAGYMDDITGMYKMDPDAFGESACLYDPYYNWVCYEENGMCHTYGELCYEAHNYNTGTNYIQYDGTTTYNANVSVSEKFAGKIGNKPINVLKVNEEASASYPYYKYTKANGETEDLPAGCVIYQFGCHFDKSGNLHDHLFLTLGNLGTSDAAEAGNILVQKGIITEEQKQYVTSKGSSNYWRIENNGAEGCVINNADVSSETIIDGQRKGCDSIWAFQLFGDEKPKSGSFGIELVKYEQGTTKPLSGANFKVEIPALNYSDTQSTGDDGKATFRSVDIDGEGKTYSVKVTELEPPEGYIGIDDEITFDVTTTLVGEDTYQLVPAASTKYGNAAIVVVEAGMIRITEENRTTSIDIHKGVKTVENQDSGYYSVAKAIEEAEKAQAEEDAARETEYEDETTGETYNEVELEELQHEWVVETTIPENVTDYNKYLVTDPIDLNKLDFSGLDRVKVELIDASGNVVKALAKDTDYLAEYAEEEGILTVTYINKKDGNNFMGAFLSEDTTTKNNKIRLTFNTTFRVNPETGKLVVLEGTITNADNKATLKYDNGNGEDKEKDSENPEVHTGAVSIFKYEDANGNGKHDQGEKALVGAEFKIALSEEDAKNGKFVKIGGEELVAVSNEHGLATFYGLSFGGDAKDDEENLVNGLYKYDWEKASRDYYIVETKTPAGYEKVTDVLKVTVSKHSSEIIDLTDKINELDSIGNKPLKFDLALRKWVTHAYVTENGQTVEYKTGHKAEDDPESVVKVDLKKSKLNNVTVKFKYSIRITNEGEIAGEAREITDYIPAGLKFVQEDNPYWTTTSDERVVKTRKLEGVTLQPGESAEVEIMLTWVNSKENMGVMTNTAEISEDYNEYGVHDIDSTPNNKKAGEDDIDDAPVMLAIKTGSEVIGYASIGFGFVTIVTAGVVMIRRKFANV